MASRRPRLATLFLMVHESGQMNGLCYHVENMNDQQAIGQSRGQLWRKFKILAVGGTALLSAVFMIKWSLTEVQGAVNEDTWLTAIADVVVGEIPAQPNFLIMFADDLGSDKLASYDLSSVYAPLPALAALASKGVQFNNAYGAYLCSPFRAMLETGRLGHQTGITNLVDCKAEGLALSEISLAEKLNFYDSSWIGKVHIWGAENGVDEWIWEYVLDQGWKNFSALTPQGMANQGICGDGIDVENKLTNYVAFNSGGVVKNYKGSKNYADKISADAAVSEMARMSEPWLLKIAFNGPHSQHDADGNSQWVYPPTGLWPAPDYGAYVGTTLIQKKFHAMAQALDHEVGKILGSIPNPENTCVIFMADNGSAGEVVLAPLLNSDSKNHINEMGTRIPFLVYCPGAPTGVSEALVGVSDIYATVSELAGVPLDVSSPAFGSSFSLVRYLDDPTAPSQRGCAFRESGVILDDLGDSNWEWSCSTTGYRLHRAYSATGGIVSIDRKELFKLAGGVDVDGDGLRDVIELGLGGVGRNFDLFSDGISAEEAAIANEIDGFRPSTSFVPYPALNIVAE